jgi:anti-anti-sigma regulatory factor
MKISVNQASGRVPVAILAVQGDLDASNYQDLIAKAQQAYAAGTGHILLDLTQTSFISSSGLVALHSIALLLQGERPPDPESGWSAIHAVGQGLSTVAKQHIKLLNPQPKVQQVLVKSGLAEFFEIHTDLTAAIASF